MGKGIAIGIVVAIVLLLVFRLIDHIMRSRRGW